MDTQLEERLRHDLFDVTRDVGAPVGFAHDALRSGRRLRRRRTSTLVAVGAAAVVAAVLLVPGPRGGGDSGGRTASDVDGPSALMQWSRSLPLGPAASIPVFTDAGIRDGDTIVPVPDSVDRSTTPQRVVNGWVVLLDKGFQTLAPAVVSADGTVHPLPAYSTDESGVSYRGVFVSPDTRKVAYGDRVVDVETLDTSAIPHDPALVANPDPDFSNVLQISGWSDEGLVYRGAPTEEGWGTEWLLRPDYSTVELGSPESKVFSYGNGVAGYALTYDYSEKKNTCTTLSTLTALGWDSGEPHCMGRYLGESLDLSPDGRFLLTDDLPEIWDVANGEWVTLDAPAGVLDDAEEGWMGAIGWESADSFLIPVVDAADGGRETVQVVRCYVGSRDCERAGEELDVAVEAEPDSMWGPAPAYSFGDY